ncbi:exported hypothetical protein [uncultured delta proteobacterium]|uniref:Lipoprotein n=1 Tax=uncultured delta proteobacterium TaxID=34034 RepID=A0A212JFE0_9DELT|nr:exported hypothetical protein [uncultured delta proteobacterium]
MRRALLVLATMACLGLTGCGYHGPLMSLPSVNDFEAAEIIVIRENSFYGSGGASVVSIDKQEVFALENGAYISFRVKAGDCLVSGAFETGGAFGQRKDSFVQLTLKPGEKRYLYLTFNSDFPRVAWIRLVEIPAQDAEELLKKSKPAQM